ncbi:MULTISPECIES: hypothetical protein [Ramlibacter]|uniref:Lectin n=1 Tax=Ramlibacter pinisoli TaxID=2682844 RepID=A0A6N8IXT5_9BURK|nr:MULTISPECIES: hypothetical protein [Ramlibacter]MBA2961451.1 hypothetical protein [Ramlibacter sp. CGMCC 1.13660]MVQ31395.1 hypothetical protein [Ramlibacter pinisoli]
MNTKHFVLAASAASLLVACASGTGFGSGSGMGSSTGPMGFFATSVGSGKGADLGGIAGADAHCQRLATAAGAGSRTWRAYLSTPNVAQTPTTQPVAAVHARDRIGAGPWYNAKGVLVARNVDQLHASGNNVNKETVLDERGNPIKGRSDTPNEHDMLTGSRADGTAFAPQTDTTCKAWTSSSDGSAIVGHHDLSGPTNDNWAKSWNFSHQSAGCSQEALVRTGGAGKFYCFAAN